MIDEFVPFQICDRIDLEPILGGALFENLPTQLERAEPIDGSAVVINGCSSRPLAKWFCRTPRACRAEYIRRCRGRCQASSPRIRSPQPCSGQDSAPRFHCSDLPSPPPG